MVTMLTNREIPNKPNFFELIPNPSIYIGPSIFILSLNQGKLKKEPCPAA